MPDRPVKGGSPMVISGQPERPNHLRIGRLTRCANDLSRWSYYPAPGSGGRSGTPRRYGSIGPRVLDDLVAQIYAFNADCHTGHAGTGDQHVNPRLCFAAETAFQAVAIHRRLRFIAIRHQISLPAARRQPRPAKQPAPHPVLGLPSAWAAIGFGGGAWDRGGRGRVAETGQEMVTGTRASRCHQLGAADL